MHLSRGIVIWIFIRIYSEVAQSEASQTLGDFTFRYFNILKTYDDAQKHCACNDGWIAEPRYQDIDNVMSSMQQNSVWIGLTWKGKWQWGNGNDVLYENWEIKNDTPFKDCATRSTSGRWLTSYCNASARFICQYDSTFIGNQELDFRGKARFSVALSNCMKNSWAGLVDVKSKALNDYIKTSVTGNKQFFLGGRYEDSSAQWKWSDGCLVEFTSWKPGEPNRYDEKCIAITSAGWIDVSCTSSTIRRHICEKDVSEGACPRPLCSSRGNCTRIGKRYSCYCDPSYYGSKCERDYCDSSPCMNSGTCLVIATPPYYECSCFPEFSGIHCSNHTYVESNSCKYHINHRGPNSYFSDAKGKCSELNATLAMIKTFEIQNVIEQQMVKQYGLHSTTMQFWFGGEKSSDGVWYWEDGTIIPLTGPDQKWKYADRNFAFMSLYWTSQLSEIYWGSGFMHDKIKGFICEKPKSNPCLSINCLNNGSCVSVGCYAKCLCSYPFYGDYCGSETLRITSLTITRVKQSQVNVSCIFRGFPNPTVIWLLRSGESPMNISKFNDTIFLTHQSNVARGTISVLEIKQRDFLGSSEIGCFAMNSFETTGTNFSSPNSDLMISSTTSYQIFKRLWRSSEAKNICSVQGRQTIQILDSKTQNWIANELNEYHYTDDVYIDLEKHAVEDDFVWTLSNGTVIYNESAKDNSSSPGALNKMFTAWGEFEPFPSGNCVVLRQSDNWKWATINCSQEATVICQKPVDGTPERLSVVVKECQPVVAVSLLSRRSKFLIHRIEIIHNDKTVVETYEEIPSTSDGNIEKSFHLENDTLYNIKVIVCPNCPSRYWRSMNITTDKFVETEKRNVSVVDIMRNSNKCMVKWEVVNNDGVVGFQIVAIEHLNVPIVGAVETQNIIVNFSRDVRGHRFTMKPNRRYEVTAQTKTCDGLGAATFATGSCITDTTAPETIASPTAVVNSNGQPLIGIVLPDETNGPISCVLVLVVYNPSSNMTEINTDILEKALATSESTTLQQNDVYLAVVMPRNSISNENRYFEKVLGDGSKSECTAASTNQSNRRKRELSKETKFVARNRELEERTLFRVFVVTVTPGASTIHIKSSDPTDFTAESFERNSNGFPVAAAVGIAIGFLLVLTIVVLMLMKKNSLGKKVKDQKISMMDIKNEEFVYENLNVGQTTAKTETAISMNNLLSKYNQLSAANNEEFKAEFQKLKEEAKKLDFPAQVASNEAVRKKNRFRNIVPADHSRVPLQSAEFGYINASYIHGFEKAKKFIATQGPLKNTVEDFWSMVIEQKCGVIVMLTKCVERSKIKCEKYWPDKKKTVSYGAVSIQSVSERSYGSYILRTFNVNKENQNLEVKQIHFLSWPDHGIPATTTSIMNIQKVVENLNSEHPVIVHCSAGAGRTGAFIAYDFVKNEGKTTGNADVYGCIMSMRQNRHDMVQSLLQYVLVHKMLLENHLFGDTSVSKEEFKDKIRREKELEQEFRNLSLVSPVDKSRIEIPSDQEQKEASAPYQRSYVNILLRDDEIQAPYINASIIECYDPKIRNIAAESPTNSTKETFWRCILDNRMHNVVMLTCSEEISKKESVLYWPEDKNTPLFLMGITISLVSCVTEGKTIHRVLHVSREKDELDVNHYQFIGWSERKCPENSNEILQLIEKLKQIDVPGKASVLVHCSDGVGRTGVFCALLNMLTQLKYDDSINMFRTVKDLRDCRAGMVKSFDQYKFCCSSLVAHLNSIDLYYTMADSAKEVEESIYENL